MPVFRLATRHTHLNEFLHPVGALHEIQQAMKHYLGPILEVSWRNTRSRPSPIDHSSGFAQARRALRDQTNNPFLPFKVASLHLPRPSAGFSRSSVISCSSACVERPSLPLDSCNQDSRRHSARERNSTRLYRLSTSFCEAGEDSTHCPKHVAGAAVSRDDRSLRASSQH